MTLMGQQADFHPPVIFSDLGQELGTGPWEELAG